MKVRIRTPTGHSLKGHLDRKFGSNFSSHLLFPTILPRPPFANLFYIVNACVVVRLFKPLEAKYNCDHKLLSFRGRLSLHCCWELGPHESLTIFYSLGLKWKAFKLFPWTSLSISSYIPYPWYALPSLGGQDPPSPSFVTFGVSSACLCSSSSLPQRPPHTELALHLGKVKKK